MQAAAGAQQGSAAAPRPPPSPPQRSLLYHWYKAQSLKSPAAGGRWGVLAERETGGRNGDGTVLAARGQRRSRGGQRHSAGNAYVRQTRLHPCSTSILAAAGEVGAGSRLHAALLCTAPG